MTPSRRLGKYRLISKIADGGMAEVFLAVVGGIGGFQKRVALKLILPHFTRDVTFVQSFVNEARICGQLHHPNLVQVYEFQQIDNEYYCLAMEFIEGLDLERILNHRLLHRALIPAPVAVEIVFQMLEGLEYAHTARDMDNQPLNVVHRDLKPSNILIDLSGLIKIVDFGVAKASSNLYKTMNAGLAKGTVSYMSPEQASGRLDLGPPSDVFSVGSILYELLTLQRLFDGDNLFAILDKVRGGTLDPSLEKIRDVPPPLVQVLRRALTRELSGRYTSAAEMARDLRAIYPESASEAVLARFMDELASQGLEAVYAGPAAEITPAAALEAVPRDANLWAHTPVLTPDTPPRRSELLSVVEREKTAPPRFPVTDNLASRETVEPTVWSTRNLLRNARPLQFDAPPSMIRSYSPPLEVPAARSMLPNTDASPETAPLPPTPYGLAEDSDEDTRSNLPPYPEDVRETTHTDARPAFVDAPVPDPGTDALAQDTGDSTDASTPQAASTPQPASTPLVSEPPTVATASETEGAHPPGDATASRVPALESTHGMPLDTPGPTAREEFWSETESGTNSLQGWTGTEDDLGSGAWAGMLQTHTDPLAETTVLPNPDWDLPVESLFKNPETPSGGAGRAFGAPLESVSAPVRSRPVPPPRKSHGLALVLGFVVLLGIGAASAWTLFVGPLPFMLSLASPPITEVAIEVVNIPSWGEPRFEGDPRVEKVSQGNYRVRISEPTAYTLSVVGPDFESLESPTIILNPTDSSTWRIHQSFTRQRRAGTSRR